MFTEYILKDVFSKHSILLRDFGNTNLVSHKINLSYSDPPKQRLYREAMMNLNSNDA